jgi:DNA-binding NarL/FixJ family response regulator
MPGSAERVTRGRVVDLLRVAEGVSGYAAREIGNGLEPDEVRAAALEAAGDLEAAASALRRLARPDPVPAGPSDEASRRRALALELAGRGWSRQAIAERLGVNAETARRYLRVSSRP